MMIKIDFKGFWKMYERELSNHTKMHYIERAESYLFYFKAKDTNGYYTIIELQSILDFAVEDEIEYEAVLNHFFNTYLVNAIKIEEIVGLEEPEVVYEDEYIEVNFKKELDAGEDVVEEADDYSDFFVKNVQLWKHKVTKRLEDVTVDKSYLKKTFGQFVQATLNTINTRPFLSVVRKYVKQGMTAGMESAETETGVDIGFTAKFSSKLSILENQQLNGYSIHGKMWYGIKGATKEIQARVLRQIAEDVQTQTSKTVMIDHIKEIFDGVATSQAKRIARTETTRFISEGKITGYEESGVKGNKAWTSVHDNHTSELCDRLHKKYFDKGIPYDEQFVDDVTGQRFDYPPGHPNCRSAIEFRQIKPDS